MDLIIPAIGTKKFAAVSLVMVCTTLWFGSSLVVSYSLGIFGIIIWSFVGAYLWVKS